MAHQVNRRFARMVRMKNVGKGQDTAFGVLSGRDGSRTQVVGVEFAKREGPLAASGQSQPFIGYLFQPPDQIVRYRSVVKARADARFFKLIVARAEFLETLPVECEVRQIHDRVVANLQPLKARLTIDGQEVRQSLMKGYAPPVVLAKPSELPDRFDYLFRRADRVGESDGEIRADAVCDEAPTRWAEEVSLVRPEFEVVERRAPIPGENLFRRRAFVRQRAVAINDRAKEREPDVSNQRRRDHIKRIEKPRGVACVRRKSRVADPTEIKQRLVDRGAPGEIDSELPLIEQPEACRAVPARREHRHADAQRDRTPIRQAAANCEIPPRPP